MENKKEFVSQYFKPLMLALRINVKDVYYERRPHDGYIGDEYVVVVFSNGYTKQICVTADSLIALVRDALKEL